MFSESSRVQNYMPIFPGTICIYSSIIDKYVPIRIGTSWCNAWYNLNLFNLDGYYNDNIFEKVPFGLL